MPYPFSLPTTSHLSFPQFLTSSTHPSLPAAATASRTLLRDVLKRHKRLPPASQPSHLSTVLSALNNYIPYLFALDAGFSGISISGEEVDVVLERELEVEWRCTLSLPLVPGRDPERKKMKSLESELFFTLQALGFVYVLIARAGLRPLYVRTSVMLDEEKRKAVIAGAMQNLLSAQAVHAYLLARVSGSQAQAMQIIPDISPSVQSALAELALAEATLITVLKDDPYASAVAEERNKSSKDWMFKAPEMPKVRAMLFARLCLAAAEHAANGLASARNVKGVDEKLVQYLDDLRCTARAKAARFLGIDAEGVGKVGEGIAWLRGARNELGFSAAGDEGTQKRGLGKLRKEWKEKREDKKVERADAEWGGDAGRFEEGRALDMLLSKWEKMNDTVNVQLIPSSADLLAAMPSGREYHYPKPYQITSLAGEVIARMRAPADPTDSAFQNNGGDSDSDEDTRAEPVGAFPGTRADYTPSSSTYY
ncbi:pH-response regulator protein-like protein palC [Venturia nashicola]|uniref:pH-response regulator protein palC n=1 Tax=Venturia nashicola TaxID=86259 RepID=A0A4Z1NN56_9PEZI|nr:pH-response regulator protein-like protein palC [Venturia nashicola]